MVELMKPMRGSGTRSVAVQLGITAFVEVEDLGALGAVITENCSSSYALADAAARYHGNAMLIDAWAAGALRATRSTS